MLGRFHFIHEDTPNDTKMALDTGAGAAGWLQSRAERNRNNGGADCCRPARNRASAHGTSADRAPGHANRVPADCAPGHAGSARDSHG